MMRFAVLVFVGAIAGNFALTAAHGSAVTTRRAILQGTSARSSSWELRRAPERSRRPPSRREACPFSRWEAA
jgi:hypothetical protein